MLLVFVRLGDTAPRSPATSTSTEEVLEALPQDLASLPLTEGTTIALSKDGPFLPLREALARHASLREAVGAELDLGALRAYRFVRPWLFLALVPLFMLVEVDRELALAGAEGAGVRTLSDLFVVFAITSDLARRAPLHPKTTAIALFGAAARYAWLTARVCGHVGWPIFLAPALLVVLAALQMACAPSPASLTRDILARLRVPSRAEVAARPGLGLVVSVVATALGLPLMLAVAEHAGVGLWTRGALFTLYALAVPLLFGGRLRRVAAVPTRSPRAVLLAVVASYVLTLGVVDGAHYSLDAGANVARCVHPSSFDEGARRVLDAENAEARRSLTREREEWALFAMTVLVVPFAEERVYRGLLQRAIGRRWGSGRGVVGAAVLFGLAHLGVYRMAVYQMVLLGVSFGVAYEEGGIVAATVVHALWNLHLLL